MSKLNALQISMLKVLNDEVPLASAQAFMINLFEVLRLNQDLEKLKTSPRFPTESKWREGTHTYVRTSIYDYLVNDSKSEQLESFVKHNQNKIIDAFKDSELVKSITNFAGTVKRLFKTTNGYLYITTSNKHNEEVDQYGNVTYLNIKTGEITNSETKTETSDRKSAIRESLRIIQSELAKINSLLDSE